MFLEEKSEQTDLVFKFLVDVINIFYTAGFGFHVLLLQK